MAFIVDDAVNDAVDDTPYDGVNKGGDHMGKGKRTESQARYDENHPVITARAPRELYEQLKSRNESVTDILKAGLGVLDQALEQARQQGFEAGKQQGFETGRKEGFKVGWREGYEAGEQRGVETGKQQGWEAGAKLVHIPRNADEVVDFLTTLDTKTLKWISEVAHEVFMREMLEELKETQRRIEIARSEGHDEWYQRRVTGQ